VGVNILSHRKTAFAALLVLVLVPFTGYARKKPLPSGLDRAGVITAILYNTNLVRQSAAPVRLDNGTELAWTDTLRTDGNGRARVRLADQSVLSISSDSELNILAHDAASHKTVVQLGYGILRAQVSKQSPGQVFEVRTPAGVATVVGTDFVVDASVPTQVKFICLAGTVHISGTDAVANSVDCEAGNAVTIKSGASPKEPQPADDVLMARMRNITDPEEPAPYSPFP